MNTLINLIKGAKPIKRILQKLRAALRSMSKKGVVSEETYASNPQQTATSEQSKSTDTETSKKAESKLEDFLYQVDAIIKFIFNLTADALDLAIYIFEFLEGLNEDEPVQAN